MKLFLARLALALCIAVAPVSLASAQVQAPAQAPETPAPRLDGARLVLDQIESGLKRSDLSDADLQRLRTQLDPVSAAVQAVLTELTPQYEAVKSRLDQLGPKPTDKQPPESEGTAADRAEQERRFKAVDDVVRRARLIETEVAQAANGILSRRRALFARALFERSSSLLSPALWFEAALELPTDARALSTLVGDWLGFAGNALSGWRLFLLLGTLTLLGALYAPVARIVRRVTDMDAPDAKPDELQRALAGLGTVVSRGILPVAAAVLVAAAFDGFGIVTTRMLPLFKALTDSVGRIALMTSLGLALHAPDRPAWRLTRLGEAAAGNAVTGLAALAIVISAVKIIEAMNDAIAGSLPLSVVTRGLGAVACAVIIAYALKTSDAAAVAGGEAATPAQAEPGRNWVGVVRLALWAVAAVIVAAALVGYIAFAYFLVDQVAWIVSVLALLLLLSKLADEGLRALFNGQSRLGRGFVANLGIDRAPLEQVGVLLAGASQVVLLATAVLLVITPWGVESQDLLSSLRAAFFGFRVGDIVISPSTFVASIALFAAAIVATRCVQRWLEVKYLPQTRLDAGLRNSIRTSLGYVGFILAAALALSNLGIGFEKVALVAGALSVGIGFGLQTIVNNFVSGLILLWERAIRVGDWIVVGDEQGFVRRINVRSTEIETFERATVIVPNASLVAGVVKNWVRMDRIGRIKIEIGVAYESDPEQVHDLLVDCAKAHKLVLAIPAPSVLFTSFGDSALHFDLICFVDDIETGGRVKSDLHFDIIKRLRETGISIPYPQRDMNLRGLEKIEAALARNFVPAATPEQ